MVENSSLCLICTSKVNICCNLRINYEDKYNGKCLQRILSSYNCLLCDSNSTSLAKTQDMPSILLQQIELFMNSTSFPESYSNSVLCLTCIHFLNIWHQVRSSVMKLKQNDEIDKNYGASDPTDNNFKKTKTTDFSINNGNGEKLSVIELVDSDVEVAENPKSITLSSFKKTGSISDDVQNKVRFSGSSRSEDPSSINNKLSKKQKLSSIKQKTKQLLRNKHVIDKESLISDSSNAEIDSLIVDEIVESENEKGTLQSNSINLCSTKAKTFDGKLSINTIDDSSDRESESNTTSQHLFGKTLNFSMSDSAESSQYLSATSLNFSMRNSNQITKAIKFTTTMKDSSGSVIINEKNSQKLNQKLKLRRSSTHSKAGSQSPSRNHKRWKEPIIADYCSDKEGVQKNTQKLKNRRFSTFPNGSSKPKVLKNTKSVNNKQEVIKIINFSSEDDEIITERNKISKSKINSILKTREKNKFNKQKQTAENEEFSDTRCLLLCEVNHKEQPTCSESDTTLIDNSSDSQRNCKQCLSKRHKSRKSETQQNYKSVKDSELETMKADDLSYKEGSETESSTNKNVSSKSRKGECTENSKTRDTFWFYLNKKLGKLQSVQKLHKIEKLNLPKNRLDDKFYKQLPYIFLNNAEVQKTKMVTENLTKIKLRPSKRKSTDEESNRQVARKINRSSITVVLSDDEFHSVKKTLRCPICDNISKTLCEHKAHKLFHIKPEQVVINAVRENLKELQEQDNQKNIDKILAKYLDISELEETLSNGHSSVVNGKS